MDVPSMEVLHRFLSIPILIAMPKLTPLCWPKLKTGKNKLFANLHHMFHIHCPPRFFSITSIPNYLSPYIGFQVVYIYTIELYHHYMTITSALYHHIIILYQYVLFCNIHRYEYVYIYILIYTYDIHTQ